MPIQTQPKHQFNTLLEQLVAFRYFVLTLLFGVSGQASSHTQFQGDLALRTAYLHMVYGAVGNFIFLANFLWKILRSCECASIKGTIEKQLSGKNAYIVASFWLSIPGGGLLYHTHRNTEMFLAAQFLMALSVNLTSFDAPTTQKNNQIALRDVADPVETILTNASIRIPATHEPIHNADNFRCDLSKLHHVLTLRDFFNKLVSLRITLFTLLTASIQPNTAMSVSQKNNALRDNAMTDLLFGGLGFFIIGMALSYCLWSSLKNDIGARKTFQLLFYGRPLQISLCFLLSIASGVSFYVGSSILSVIMSALSGYLMGANVKGLLGIGFMTDPDTFTSATTDENENEMPVVSNAFSTNDAGMQTEMVYTSNGAPTNTHDVRLMSKRSGSDLSNIADGVVDGVLGTSPALALSTYSSLSA